MDGLGPRTETGPLVGVRECAQRAAPHHLTRGPAVYQVVGPEPLAAERSLNMEKSMGAGVRLVPMTESEFSAYEQAEAQEYAGENVRAGYWAEAEAIDRAWKSHRLLLPQGASTAGHHFCHVVDEKSGEHVGSIWWFEDREGSVPRAFVYHILVEPRWRRKGYGSAALMAVEAQARALGMVAVGLHVFAHNPEAIRVYERLGFRTTSLNMLKPL